MKFYVRAVFDTWHILVGETLVGCSSTLWVRGNSSWLKQPDSFYLMSLLHLMKSWTNVRIYRSYYWTWLRLAYVTQWLVVLLSHVALPHLAHRSVAARLKPGRAAALLVLALALLALQNSLIYHGERLWENQLRQNGAQQLRCPCMWREGRNSRRSAALNAAARGWQNRNKRLTGSRGHVLKLWLGEWWWWWEGQETQAAFFPPSLSVSVWSSEGTLAVQCSEARSRIHSNTDELLNSGEWMWHRPAYLHAAERQESEREGLPAATESCRWEDRSRG